MRSRLELRAAARGLAILAFVALSACATAPATGVRQVEIPLRVQTQGAKLVVRVTPPSYGMDPAVLSEILGATVAALRDTRRFGRVVAMGSDIGADSDLVLDVEIVSAREITRTLRDSVGFWAGAAEFAARLRVVETGKQGEVARAVVGAKTASSSSWSGTNSQAVGALAGEIAAVMSGARE